MAQDHALIAAQLQISVLQAEIERLRSELQWIADTPMQWTKPQGDIYWSNVALALAKKAMDALTPRESEP